ncbi:MAG TPA: AMP-binding protein, partial [Bordetella sp.]
MTDLSTSGIPAYADAVAGFDLAAEAARLHGDLERGVNACVECCDRYAGTGATALDYIDTEGRHQAFSFAQMQALAARVANLLASQGVRPGDIVAGLLPRTPEILATILGTWRAGAVYQPLFTAFGPKAIEHRLRMSQAKLVVTNTANRAKLDEIGHCPPVAVVLKPGESLRDGDIDFQDALARQSEVFEPVLRKGTDLFMMMSTSGTTGLPKGVPVPLRAMLAFAAYMRQAVDLRPGDRFWNIADPGWAYGLYYGITGPLLLGHGTTFFEGGFTVESTYDLIEKLGITSFAGAPTAYRMLMAAGAQAAKRIKGRLRVVSSAGEPLNPEVIRWFDTAVGVPIHDHYGQT